MTATALTVHGRWVPGRRAAWSVVGAGALAAVVVARHVAELRAWEAVMAGLLPLAWLVAGAIALRARPDHSGALLMAAVGSSHLAAFAITLPVAYADGSFGSTEAWLLNVVGSVLFSGGFAALALILAGYPAGSSHSPRFRRIAVGLSVLAPVLEAVTRDRVPLVITGPVAATPTPEHLVLAEAPVSFGSLPPLLVVAGAVLLVRRGRRVTGTERRQLSWAVGAAGLLALLLLATPAASVLLPEAWWSLVFVTVASVIPFVLLAGMVRFRLMDVDVYVGRTLAQGAVVVLVVTGYAAAASWVGYDSPAAVLVVVLAALTGGLLRNRLEAVVDRWFTGGRIQRRALMRHLVESLDTAAPGQVAQRTVDTVASGLEVSWVRMVLDSGVVAETGRAEGVPSCVVPLSGAGATIGRLECGPRHGGWSDTETGQVRLLARHAALAVHGEELARALAAQVEQLRSSRRRLVHAEQSVRRQLERDLHDGVQQQLVALLARLGALELLVAPGEPAAEFTRLARQQAEASLTELRELIRGIHPPVLADRGLAAAVRARAALLPLPVTVAAEPDGARYSTEVESAAYYVVSEALTNVLKHAGATRAWVELTEASDRLVITVADDGVGLAQEADGSPSPAHPAPGRRGGLAGLRDRVEALGGTLEVTARGRWGSGTTLRVGLPSETAR